MCDDEPEHGVDKDYEMTKDAKVFTDAASSGERGGGGDSGLIYKNNKNYVSACIDSEHGADDYDEMNMGVSIVISKDYEIVDNLIAGFPATAANGFGDSDGYVARAKQAQANKTRCCVATPPPPPPAKRAKARRGAAPRSEKKRELAGSGAPTTDANNRRSRGAPTAFYSHACAQRTNDLLLCARFARAARQRPPYFCVGVASLARGANALLLFYRFTCPPPP
jgi:hypothetical protein